MSFYAPALEIHPMWKSLMSYLIHLVSPSGSKKIRVHPGSSVVEPFGRGFAALRVLRSFAANVFFRRNTGGDPADDPTPAPNHFPVAAPTVRSDARKNGEWTSPPSRHPVARHGGILAPLPGTDRHPPKPKCVNHFFQNLVSQLNWPHN